MSFVCMLQCLLCCINHNIGVLFSLLKESKSQHHDVEHNSFLRKKFVCCKMKNEFSFATEKNGFI